jgi:hypothetical protein
MTTENNKPKLSDAPAIFTFSGAEQEEERRLRNILL